MAEAVSNTSRRAMLGVLAVAPVALAMPAAAASQSLIDLEAEIRAYDDCTRKLIKSDVGQAEWDRWSQIGSDLYERIEALPAIPQNARIKALGVKSIHLDDEYADGFSTDGRLVNQLLAILSGEPA